MAMTSVQLTVEVEKAIRSYLTKVRIEDGGDTDFGVSPFHLYTVIEKQFSGHNLSAGFFNKIVADMRHAGIVSENKRNSRVWLSDDAWASYQWATKNGVQS